MTPSNTDRRTLGDEAFKLSCQDQFELATRIASNIGYVLVGEPSFEPAPSGEMGREADEAMMMLGDVPGETLTDRLTKLQGWYLELQILCGDLKHKLEVSEAVNRLAALPPSPSASVEVVSPAVKRAMDFFWQKANQYDREKLQAIYNDLLALQDKTDQVPLTQALDAVGFALAATSLPDELERLKFSIDTRLNDYLCEMKPNYDDSITGFNEAWDIVRKAFADHAALQSARGSEGE